MSDHDAAVAAAVINSLADKLRQMQYDPTERSHGEARPGYREGWNDAARDALRTVVGFSLAEVKL